MQKNLTGVLNKIAQGIKPQLFTIYRSNGNSAPIE